MELTTLHQVHGATLRGLETEPRPWMTIDGKAHLQGDGILTRTPGQLVGVVTADCVPVLLADRRTHAVAALHAGWRGTLARIVEKGVAALGERYGSRPQDVVAAIGPAILACCFEVGAEVREQFRSEFSDADTLFQPAQSDSTGSRDERPSAGEGRLRMNLHAANRTQLLAAGVAPEDITVISECTACTRLGDGRRRFFSHRAEQGVTGRMLNVIGAVEA